MKKILISLAIIAAIAGVVGATTSYFSDVEVSAGNMFTAGTLNLKVGNEDPTQWGFNIENIKPGDIGTVTTTIRNIGSLDGFLHITFDNLLNEENGCIEPEYMDEPNCGGDEIGELAKNLDLLIYLEETGGTADQFDLGIDTLVYQGKARGILQGDEFNYSLLSGGSKDFRVEWELPASTNNEAQSDKAGFDIVFELTQTQKDIVGNWHFNENGGTTAYDSSGKGNHGIINGTSWTDGQYNPALSFDASGDYVDCGNDSTLDFTNTDDFTLSVWMKKDENPSSGNVMGLTGKNIKYAIDYYFAPNKLRAGIRNATDGQYIITTDAPNDLLDWTYVVFVYESEKSDGMKLYINGDMKVSRTTIGLHDFSDPDRHFQISGPATGGNIEKFNGEIDEVKIYSRALSDNEIQQNYEAGEQ